ncbi:hypothetical protein ACKI1K_43915, partial [Streptomyces scabiei]|uniref:hypothetical protein n=1 Tax=Streptomyces scabiei TaxID=1930 RepID=UPI0038F7CE85
MGKTTTYKPDTSFLQPGYFNSKKSFPLQVVTDITAKEASYILDSYSHPSQPKSRKGSRVFARAFENGVYDYRLNPLTWAWVKSAKRLYLVNGHRRTSSILSAKVDSVKLSNQIIEVEDENELR